MKPITAKRKRSKRGHGRLYKVHGGREYPADWKGPGDFWLAYTLAGERIIKALLRHDGQPITDRGAAERERLRIVGPTLAADKVQALRSIQSKLADARVELASATDAAAPGVTIAGAWDVFTADHTRPDSGDSTLRQYGFQWERFARWIMKHHPEMLLVRDVTRDTANEYATDLGKAGFSGGTINKHVGLLRLVWRILADAAGVTIDPWQKITAKKHRPHNRRELTNAELLRICDSASGELRLLLATGIYCGLRMADAATLQWSEVDTKRGIITVVPAKTARTSGKQVTLPIHATLVALLQEQAELTPCTEYVLPVTAREYLAGRGTITDRVQRHLWDNGINCHAPGTGHQIVRDGDGNPTRNGGGHVKLAPTGKRAVVAVGYHSLRHSFVSLCRSAGAPLSVVEALVGHSNPTLTRLYTHTSERESARAVASLPAFTGGGTITTTIREPLPTWAREIVATLTAKNAKAIKVALLKGGAQ